MLSLGCAIHCLLVPVIAIAWPFIGNTFVSDHSFHKVLLGLVLATAFISFISGYRHHKKKSIIALGFSGLSILTVFTIFEGDVCSH
jgi:hypothetical protein